MIEFDKTAEATTYARRKCIEAGFVGSVVNSRFIAETSRFRTRVTLPGKPSDADLSHIVAVLHDAGYRDIDVHDMLRVVEAFSALTDTSTTMAAEKARRALIDRMPESFHSDEVNEMDDAEVMEFARSNGLMDG